MLAWGFILLIGGFLACLILFLTQLPEVWTSMTNGLGDYITAFFAHFDTLKLVFIIAAFLTILGLVMYIVGLVRNKNVEGEKKTIVPAKVSKYLRDTRGEFKKIVWPNFPTVLKNTGVVLAMCAVTAAVIVLADWGLGELIKLLLGNN